MESILPEGGTLPADTAHDHDGDGIPNLLDAVNLPSEAQAHTAPGDLLQLVDGLPAGGFALLVDPSHKEAQLITADLNSELSAFFHPAPQLSASQALDQIERLQGTQARNALAMVLHADLQIHFTPIAPETALNLTLQWNGGSLPGDGSWLLVNTDPTRLMQLKLAGTPVALAARAASHFSSPGLTDYRWQLLNLHDGNSFCYDPTTALNGTECKGNNWPGWIRAYSGQAAYALEAVRAGLAGGQVPLSMPPASPTDNPTMKLSPLVMPCADAVGFLVPLVVACVPPCQPSTNLLVLCTPTPMECPPDSTGTAINGNPATCIPEPSDCPSNADLVIDTCVPTIQNCPTGNAGLVVNGAQFCVNNCPPDVIQGGCVPHIPLTESCPPGSVGPTGAGPGACLVYCSVGTTVGVCLPTYATCSFPQVGLTYNGVPYCLPLVGTQSSGSFQSPTPIPHPSGPHQLPSAPQASVAVGPTSLVRGLPLPEPDSIFDSASKWHILGNRSHSFPAGLGTDYILDAHEGGTTSRVLQVADSMLFGAGFQLSATQRPFIFQGAYYSTPTNPRSLTHVTLGIQNADGNETAQTFLIDGKRLAMLLDVRPGETLNVTIDENHKSGFRYAVRDVDGDGALDIIALVPHFSATWLQISNPATSVNFWDVKLTSATTGWISGANGAVHRYQSGQLTRVDLNGIGSGQRTMGLSVLSDSEFYVVGQSDQGNSDDAYPFIAHYVNGWSTAIRFGIGSGGQDFYSIWMKSDGSLGYVGGSQGLWLKYTSSSGWTVQSRPLNTECGIMSIQFDATGKGYVGLAKGPTASAACASGSAAATLYYNGASFTNAADSSVEMVYAIQGPTGPWAAGFQPGWGSPGGPHGPGIYRLDGTMWKQTTESAPARSYFGVAKAGATDSYWFVGRGDCACTAGTLVNRNAGIWSTYSTSYWLPDLKGIDLLNNLFGLSVGAYGTIVQFQDFDPPVALGSLSSSLTDTMTAVTADGSGSYQGQGHAVSHTWVWNDGTTTYGSPSQHRFNAPGTYTVTHTVTDTTTGQTSSPQTLTVTIQAASLTLGNPASSGTLPSDAGAVANYYVIPASSSGDRFVKLTLTGAGATETASLGTPPPMTVGAVVASGSWPAAGSASTSQLVGKIPSGHALYVSVQKPAGTGSVSYTLAASIVGAPSAPATGFASGTYPAHIGFTATTSTGERATQLKVDWGDGTVDTLPGLNSYQAGASYAPGHTYTQSGTRTITMTTRDDLGQTASITRQVTIYLDPVGVGLPATLVGAGQATLNARLDSLGGAPSITATFKLYQGTSLIDSDAQTRTATGEFNWPKSGLTSGVSYTYTVTYDNTVVALTTNPAQGFSTSSTLAITPSITSNPGTVSLGSTSSVSFKASSMDPNNVAYWIKWDTGADEVRVPASGYVPWDQVVTASTTYAFAGAHPIEVRMQDTSGARSAATLATATVTGSAPVSSFTSTSQLDTVTLSATVGGLGLSSATLSFHMQDLSTLAWPSNLQTAGTSISSGSTSWTTPTLDRSKRYLAVVELTASDGSGWTQKWATPVANRLTVQTNRAPTLQESGVAAVVNYLDGVRFAVVVQDAEGDAPSTPILNVNGVPYTMLPGSTSSNYASGREYHYNLAAGVLPEGRTSRPTYTVTDQYSRSPTLQGAGVFVGKAYAVHLDFQGDQVDGFPQGMTMGSESLNYWHVTDTQSAGMPDRIALGHHGKALWFGDPVRGTYDDPQGRTPAGTVGLLPIALNQLVRPTLSFSSYYETEDLGEARDRKLVQVCTTSCQLESNWGPLDTVSGYEGGFGAWRTQHVDLSSYSGQTVQIRFKFDATDQYGNGHLGWLIDDITLGHDEDHDTLPDVLEAHLLHGRVARQIGTATMDKDGHAKGVVRRLDRPYSENVVLTAQVHVPHPDHTSIYIGAKNDYTGETARFTVYDPSQGLRSSVCNNSPLSPGSSREGYSPFGYTSYKKLDLTDGDAFIRLDLSRCGLAGSSFVAQSDWFLAVDDTTPNLQDPVVVEGLSLESVGRTSFLLKDSDSDGVADGLETTDSGRDPLGIDEDRDGIPEGSDANDAVPEWIPAGLLAIQNDAFGSQPKVVVALADIPDEVVWSRMQAHFPGGTTQEVSPAPYSQTQWTYPLPAGEPDGLTFRWQDSQGGQGTLTVEVTRYDGGYAIYRPRLEYQNLHASYPSTIYNLAEDPERQADVAAWGLIDEVFPDPVDVVEKFLDGHKGLTTPASLALSIVGFFVREQIVMADKEKPVAPQGVSYETRNGPGPRYVYASQDLVSDASRGISLAQLEDAMQYGSILKSDSSGSMRIVRETANGPIVLRLVGTLVHDAWRWSPNTAPDWENGVGTGWFVRREEMRANDLPGIDTLPEEAPYRNCLAMCGWRSTEIHRFEFLGAGAATRGAYVDEDPIPLDVGMFNSLRDSFGFSLYLGTGFHYEADDDALGEMGIGYTSWLAKRGLLNSASLPTQFWDNGLSNQPDCVSGTAAELQTRRCSNVMVSASGANHDWSAGDNFRTHDLLWRHKDTSAVQFQDDFAVEANLNSLQGPNPPAGMERYDNTNRQMASTLGPSSNTRVLTAFDWSTAVNPKIGLHYQEANS